MSSLYVVIGIILIIVTLVVGEDTYIITIGSDGYFKGIGMSDEIKEDLMELIVVAIFLNPRIILQIIS